MRLLALEFACCLVAAAGVPSARAQSVCDLVETRAGERVSPSATSCIVDYAPIPGATTVRIILDRYDSEACKWHDERRASQASGEPRASFTELTGWGERGFEMSSGQYAREYMERDTRVVDIHPARFALGFCQPPYSFILWALHIPKDAPGVPAEVVADLRQRARVTAARIAGEPATASEVPDAIAASLLALISGGAMGPSINEIMDELKSQGLLNEDDLARPGFLSPGFKAAHRRITERLKPFGASPLVANHLLGAAALAELRGADGAPAFPATAANLGVMLELGARAASLPTPAERIQAMTALERYAAMLRNIDVEALQDRAGTPGGATTS